MSGGVRLVPWSEVTTSNVSSHAGDAREVVDELADERVGGADLHAVQLVLHARAELVAGASGSVISSGENDVRTPVRDRTHGRCGQGHVDDVQRGRAVDGLGHVAQHPGLAERAALGGVEPCHLA